MVAKPVPKQPTIPIEYKTLLGTLSKPLDDKKLEALLAKSGKVRIQKPRRDGQYVFAKEAGYTLLLEPEPGAKRGTPMRVSQIFLHYPGQDGARGFAFPHGISYGQTQPDVRKQLGKPKDTSNPYSDGWPLDGVMMSVTYSSSADESAPLTVCDVRITPLS